MIRSLIPSILLFFLPFVLYSFWLGYQRKNAGEVVDTRRHVLAVGAVGLVLAISGFVYFTDFSGATPDEVYVPPRYENGVLVPGHFAPRTEP